MERDLEILNRWERVRAVRGEDVAVAGPAGEPLRRFADIEAEAVALAAALAEIEPGRVVAIKAENNPGWFALLLAFFRRGLIPMPLPVSTDTSGVEDSAGTAARATWTGDAWRFDPLPHAAPCWSDGQPDFLKVTSGTTAAPRVVKFSAAQLLADCDQVCSTMGLTARDVNHAAIPFSHSYGFSNLVTPLLCHGMAMVLAPDPFPRAILAGLEAGRASALPGVPALFQSLAAIARPMPPSLRLAVSAGAPLAAETAKRFAAVCGTRIHSFYGASECGGIAYDRDGLAAEGHVGQPMDGVRIEWLEGDNETSGRRIAVGGPAVGMGYHPATPEDTLAGGVFHPPDLLEETGDGLRIVGRQADFINCGGRKLNPAEVEAVVRTYPGVNQSVVLGLEGRRSGETIAGLVAAEEEIDPADLSRHCARRLPAWQVPKTWRVVRSIPVNERGKTNRKELARMYFSE